MTTRDLLVKSWRAASAQANAHGAVTLTPAAFAGYALERGVTVGGARALVPSEETGPYWAVTLSHLAAVEHEEMVGGELGAVASW